MTGQLSGQNLCLLRGDRCLFKDLDFSLSSGELLLIEGPNGSGKTSLLRGIAGLLDFAEGSISWQGQPVAVNSQDFRAQLSWFAHKVGFKNDLTLVENLRFESNLRHSRLDKLEAVLARLGLTKLTGLPLGVLSAGQQRRGALARMLLATGRLWMLDEPFTNLDSDGQALVLDLMTEHLAAGGLCIAASHQAVQISAPVQHIGL